VDFVGEVVLFLAALALIAVVYIAIYFADRNHHD